MQATQTGKTWLCSHAETVDTKLEAHWCLNILAAAERFIFTGTKHQTRRSMRTEVWTYFWPTAMLLFFTSYTLMPKT